jgi:hypothetical protein
VPDPQKMVARLAFFCAAAAAAVLAQPPSHYAPYDPTPNSAAVVIQGRTRVTLLSPTLVRFDSNTSSAGFDDRATFQVVNRRLPAPAFTTARINASAVTITTAALTITVVDGATPGADTCVNPRAGADAISPTRSPKYPNGVAYANGTMYRVSQAQCCAACNNDTACTAWVWASDSQLCWPLQASAGQVSAPNRVLGGRQSSAHGISVRFTGPGGAA